MSGALRGEEGSLGRKEGGNQVDIGGRGVLPRSDGVCGKADWENDKKRILGIRDFNTKRRTTTTASITPNNDARLRRHFSRVFAPFLPEKLPTRAESRNLIPGEGRTEEKKEARSLFVLLVAPCCFTAVFADLHCRR